MSERICRGCGQILRTHKKHEYKMKINLKRNIYYCNRCYSNLEEKKIAEYVRKLEKEQRKN